MVAALKFRVFLRPAESRLWHAGFRLLMICVLGVVLTACGGRVDLITGVSESEANDVLSALLDAGFNAEKSTGKDGVTISVTTVDVARALDTLKTHGLPREQFSGMGQIFRKEGLVSSPTEEQARYIYALSQELANTLTQIDGVLTARVHVVLPERGDIGEPSSPSTAAVFIKHRSGYVLDALQPQIRQLVTHSIPSLAENRVSVVLIPAQPGAETVHAHQLTHVLGVPVPLGAVTQAWLVVGGLLALLILALAGCGWLGWRYAWPVLHPAADRAHEPKAASSSGDA